MATRSEPTIEDNLARILRHYGLLDHVHLTLFEPDRGWGWADAMLFNLIVAQGWDPSLRDVAEHEHGTKVSFREPNGVRPALQVCFHPFMDHYFVELDFDLASPWSGIGGFLTHSWEVLTHWLTGSKTNQARISAMLDKRGIPS